MKKRIIAFLMMLLLVFSMTGCGAKSAVKKTIGNFEKACKKADVDAMLDCMVPEIADPIKGISSLFGSLTGTNGTDALEELISMVFDSEYFDEETMKTMKIKVGDVAVKGNNATALCSFVIKEDGEKKEQDATFKLEKVEKNWKIKSIDFFD